MVIDTGLKPGITRQQDVTAPRGLQARTPRDDA